MDSKDVVSVAEVAPETFKKVYSNNAIFFSTFFGGPIAGCYLISENFKKFGQTKLAKKVLLSGIFITFFIGFILFSLPSSVLDKIPHSLIPIIYVLAISIYARHTQQVKIKKFLEEGGKKYSWWRIIIVTLISLALMMVLIVAIIAILSMIFKV